MSLSNRQKSAQYALIANAIKEIKRHHEMTKMQGSPLAPIWWTQVNSVHDYYTNLRTNFDVPTHYGPIQKAMNCSWQLWVNMLERERMGVIASGFKSKSSEATNIAVKLAAAMDGIVDNTRKSLAEQRAKQLEFEFTVTDPTPEAPATKTKKPTLAERISRLERELGITNA